MTDLFSLRGRSAIVTGAGRGLGAAAARALAAAGARILLVDIDTKALEQQASAMTDLGQDCHALALDITDAAGRASALALAAERHGGLDILVNNAGIMLRKPIVETSADEFRRVLDINVVAMASFAAEAFPLLAASRGRIINLSSIMGRIGRAGQVTYVAAKHAVEGLTKSLAAEFGPHGITVNAIAPGYFQTEMNAAIIADEAFNASIVERTPLRRWADPDEIGGAMVFLASDAAAFITGHVLMIDGGVTATVPGPSSARGRQ